MQNRKFPRRRAIRTAGIRIGTRERTVMSPVNTSSYGPGGRGFHGVVTVGQRGQVAIPAKARRDLGIEAGAQLVVLTDPNEGIALIPLELLLSKQDHPVAKLVRSTLPGVTRPDGENADDAAGRRAEDAAGKHTGDAAGKVADGGGDSR